jgi:ethanolamine transporter EutH
VVLDARRSRVLRRELRDLVFKLCSIAGVALVFLWALHHQATLAQLSRGACSRHAAGHAATITLGRCLGSELPSIMRTWVIPIGVGALLGAIIALGCALMIRVERGPRRGGAGD